MSQIIKFIPQGLEHSPLKLPETRLNFNRPIDFRSLDLRFVSEDPVTTYLEYYVELSSIIAAYELPVDDIFVVVCLGENIYKWTHGFLSNGIYGRHSYIYGSGMAGKERYLAALKSLMSSLKRQLEQKSDPPYKRHAILVGVYEIACELIEDIEFMEGKTTR